MTTHAIPQLAGLPLLGNALDFKNRRLELLLRTTQTCGDIGAFTLGNNTVLVVNEARLIQEVLVNQGYRLTKPNHVRRYLRPIIGDGLFVIEGEPHRARRKVLAPLFQPRQVARYAEQIAAAVAASQTDWTDKAVINVHDATFRLALAVVGRTLFGVDVLGDAQPIGAAITFIMSHVSNRLSSLVQLPLHWPTPGNRRYQRAIAVLDEALSTIIRSHQSSKDTSSDLLRVLMDTHQLTPEEVRWEALNLLIAGHETTANALAWIWWLLGQHPTVYQRLQAEVDTVLGGTALQLDDLNRMPYVLQVIREALRLYPPAYIIPRKAIEPVELPGGLTLPPETRVLISPYALHRRADYFPDPETFNPDRFAPEREQDMPRYTYLPFGVGPHACIGAYFATLEMQIALVTTMQRFKLELLPDQRVIPEPLVALRPSTFHMQVTPR